MIKDVLAMFYTPLYIFHFPRHEELKQQAMQLLTDDRIYAKYDERHVHLSGPNLHKEEALRPHYYFMKDCIQYAMADLGYKPDVSITSMWATKQSPGQYHHPHKHGNTFLAGVYYMHGDLNNSGTAFYNPDNLLQISPDRDLDRPHRLSARHISDFHEGDFVVFPAWVLHSTSSNITSRDRYVLAINSMPCGKMVDEVYDRYKYNDAEAMNLDHTEQEYQRYRNGLDRTRRA